MECLVTKLKGTVDDATLVRLGETKFEFEKGVTKTLSITPISGTTLSVRIVGDGYFTNSSYSSNNGTELSISERTRLYLSSEVEAIALGDKSNVLKLWITQNEAHLKSGFGALSYLTKMDEIEFHGIGDISDCKTPFNNIYSYIGTMDVNVAYFGKDSKATFASLAKVFPNLTSLMANGTFGSFEGSFAGMSDKITRFIM